MKKKLKSRVVLAIYARKGRGPEMVFSGRSFNNQPDAPVKTFLNQTTAAKTAKELLSRYAILKDYKIWVGPVKSHRRARNPSQRDKLDVAAEKLENFSGHRATKTVKGRARSTEKTGLVIGELDLIGYRARRDGKSERYGHKFRKVSRPLLAVSSDGKQLHIVGGRYEFTEAGIEDR